MFGTFFMLDHTSKEDIISEECTHTSTEQKKIVYSVAK